MEKNDSTRPNYESKSILGYLYDNVSCKEYYKRNIGVDHFFSIEKAYNFNSFILKVKRNEYEYKAFEEYLVMAYKTIVHPLVEALKSTMLKYCLPSEADLFCTNLSFNLGDEDFSRYIGNPG